MMIKLPQVNMNFYNCYQICIAMLSQYYNNNNYKMMMLGKWAFEFDEKTKTIGKGIKPYVHRTVDGAQRFHGIKLINEDSSIESIYAILTDFKKPLIAEVDLYDCNWNKAYHKYHYKHYFILNGIDETSIYGCDPYFNANKISININYFLSIVKNVWSYYYSPVHYLKKDVLYELKKDATFNIKTRMNEKINTFFTCLKKANTVLETQGYEIDLFAIPLIDNIKAIHTNHAAYCNMIEFVIDSYGCNGLRNILNEMNICTNHWFKVKNILMRSLVVEEFDHEMLNKIGNNIINLEKSIIENISNFVEEEKL